MANKWVYLFTEGNANMRELLGGKGANLAEMTGLGLPVPQGFTITTEACTQYYEDGREINAEIQAQINEYIEKMEEIARQVPLSRLERPKWDQETMRKTGFLDVSCDENVWKEVWTEEEIINNSSSPIFLLTGRKRDAFHLKNIAVKPGEKWNGELELANGELKFPTTVFHGHGTGKTMLITAGVQIGRAHV